jgi:tetratricopeptide (TPR) repeat protein
LYDSLNAKWSSPDLLYNIGNCHFKRNDVPHAILFYERALRLAPGAEDIQANLDLARSRVADRVNELPAFTLGGSWDRTLAGTDNDQWARRSLWAMLLLCSFLAGWRIVRHRAWRGALLGLSALAFIGLSVSLLLAFRRLNETSNASQAIVMTPRVDVRSEPRQGATTLFVLHEGTKVTVLQTNGDWNEVRLPNGSVGWMPPASLVRI